MTDHIINARDAIRHFQDTVADLETVMPMIALNIEHAVSRAKIELPLGSEDDIASAATDHYEDALAMHRMYMRELVAAADLMADTVRDAIDDNLPDLEAFDATCRLIAEWLRRDHTATLALVP